MNLKSILILGALSAFGPLAIDFYSARFSRQLHWRSALTKNTSN